MGLRERLFGRQRENPEQEMRFRQTEEDYAQDCIIYLNIKHEQGYATTVGYSQSAVRDASPFVREVAARMTQEIVGRRSRDQLLDIGIENILSQIGDPVKRKQIKLKGLEAAREFWEEELGLPDNQTRVIMMGRRRITRITSYMDKLANDDKPREPS